MNYLKSLFKKVLDCIFPETCVLCGRENTSLCEACVHKLPFAEKTPHLYIYPIFNYKNEAVRTIIYALKFKHTQSILNHLVPYLYNTYISTREESLSLSQNKTYLMSVPTLKKHTHKRGFDHMHYVCKILLETYPAHFELIPPNTVLRVNTKPQVGLGRAERLLNMKDGFSIIHPQNIRDKTICIVDDVTTTGATMAELQKILIQHGATSVYGISIAH